MTESSPCYNCDHDSEHRYPVPVTKNGITCFVMTCEVNGCLCMFEGKRIAELELSVVEYAKDLHLSQRDVCELEEMLEKSEAIRKQFVEDFKNLDKEYRDDNAKVYGVIHQYMAVLHKQIADLQRLTVDQAQKLNNQFPTQWAYDAACRALFARHREIEAREEEDQRKTLEIATLELTRKNLCEILDKIWQIMYPGLTDWEYPGQVLSHLRVFVDDKDDELKTVHEKLTKTLNSMGAGGSWW